MVGVLTYLRMTQELLLLLNHGYLQLPLNNNVYLKMDIN